MESIGRRRRAHRTAGRGPQSLRNSSPPPPQTSRPNFWQLAAFLLGICLNMVLCFKIVGAHPSREFFLKATSRINLCLPYSACIWASNHAINGVGFSWLSVFFCFFAKRDDERRERNRGHAKRSRHRKKFLLESLQDQVSNTARAEFPHFMRTTNKKPNCIVV